MTQQQLFSILKSINLPVAYYSFKSSGITPIPEPPYIVYLLTDSDNMGADNKVYAKFNNYQIELYSIIKNMVSEQKLEDLFDTNNIFYDKTETFIESESLLKVAYSIQI